MAYVEVINNSIIWTVPSGVTSIIVEGIGTGGRGGSASRGGCAGGGGGGAYAKKTLSVTPGQQYIASSLVDTFNLSPYTFLQQNFGSNLVLLRAYNGLDGQGTYYIDETDFRFSGAGGAGGSSSSSVGDLVYAGGNGASGIEDTRSGGGGGAAGSTGVGGNTINNNAGIGTSLYGGNGGAGLLTQGNGISGNNYGGGGGGALRVFSASGSNSGGVRGNGYIRITYNDIRNSNFFSFF